MAALTAALFLAGCQAETAPVSKTERPVQIQRVIFENGTAAREFVGVVRARYETDLGFRISGKIISRRVNVGDRVRKGDIIAQLDPQDHRLQVESAEAELTAATSNLAQAAADLERYTTLKARGFAAIAEYDRKRRPTMRPKAVSHGLAALLISPATNLPMPTLEPIPTA